jgi:hypothetical protein
MEPRVWFYYAKEQQVGPLRESELRHAIASGLVTLDDYIYKEGYADWKFLREVKELSDTLKSAGSPPVPREAVKNSLKNNRTMNRAPIRELVVAHNEANVAFGHISNISVNGVFLETPDNVFELNDELKLTLKEGRGLGKPMHLKAVVVRLVNQAGMKGYGLELRGIDETIKAKISEYVKKNQAS